MTPAQLKSSAATDPKPPAGLSPEAKALWFTKKGDWEAAHGNAQDIETPSGSWLHALLHLIEGDLEQPKLPLIPGHQIVATVEANGPGADRFKQGERVGVRPETVVYPLERAQEALEDLRDGRAEGSLVLQVA